MEYDDDMPNDPRRVLEKLCVQRGEDFAGLSRLLGKNSAYIQQYIRRGTPRKLGEEERRTLARYFGVAESLLGGPALSPADHDLVAIGRREVRVSAGPGTPAIDGGERPGFAFDPAWLRSLTSAAPDDLSIVAVQGDSMAPTLNHGDDVLVDSSIRGDKLRDGIYVLRVDENLLVKRIAVHPLGRTVTIQSDNPAYADWPDCDLADVDCIGRVIWAGRRVT